MKTRNFYRALDIILKSFYGILLEWTSWSAGPAPVPSNTRGRFVVFVMARSIWKDGSPSSWPAMSPGANISSSPGERKSFPLKIEMLP